MTHSPAAAVALVLLVLASGCSLFDEECGLLDGLPSVYVRATDTTTGRPITNGIEVVARDGAFSETLVGEGGQYVGVFNRPGTYTVTVSGGGYETASASVVVGVRECGGETYADEASVEVALSPAAP